MTAYLFPVLDGARKRNLWDAADAPVVIEVRLHGVHERQLRHRQLHQARRAEVALHELAHILLGLLPDGLRKIADHVLQTGHHL